MTTLAQAARQLPPTPSDPLRPYLLVSEGDLSAVDEVRLASYPHPYIVILGLPETIGSTRVGGSATYRAVIDVVLEHRPVDGKRPSYRPITELRQLVLALPDFVNELTHGVPLTRSLRYIGGIRPEAKYQSPETLSATCRFETAWRLS